jgi:protoheme IX farnesyltransferase
MLPVTHGEAATRLQILLYTLVLVPVTLLLAPLSGLGLLYAIPAALLGGWFIREAIELYRAPSTPRAVRLFRYSIVYLFALFLIMTVDAIARSRPFS